MQATTTYNAVQSDLTNKSTLIERIAPQPAERAPISMAPIERVRSTSATQRRIENMLVDVHCQAISGAAKLDFLPLPAKSLREGTIFHAQAAQLACNHLLWRGIT